MDTLDKQAYAIAVREWEGRLIHSARRSFARLHRLTARLLISFAAMSCFLFFLCFASYLHHRLELTAQTALIFFILSVTGCLLSSLSLLSEKGFFRMTQAFASLIGNTIVLTLAFGFWM